MSDPWQILSLSPTEATEKDVKIAYAKLIKIHRPDTDPEGFQRVRMAYEEALEQLRNGLPDEEFVPMTWVNSPEDLPEDPIESLPYEVTQAADRLREVVRIKHRSGAESVLWELYNATRQAQVPGHLVGTLVLQIFGDELPFWINAIPMEFIFDLVLLGDIQFAHAAFESWWKVGSFSRGQELAQKLLQAAPTMVGEEMGLILAAAGIYCGFWFPQLARDLGQAAFKLVGAGARDNVLQQLDQQVMLGQLFEGMPFEQRVFWRERLREPDAESWKTDQGREILAAALRSRGLQWPAWNLVGEQLPGWVRSRLQERQKAASTRTTYRSSGSSGSGRFAWLLVPVLITFFRVIGTLSTNTPVPHLDSYPPIVTQQAARDALARIEKHRADRLQSLHPTGTPLGPNQPAPIAPPWPTLPSQSTPISPKFDPNSITAPFENPLITPSGTPSLPPPTGSGSSSQMPDLSHWQNPRH